MTSKILDQLKKSKLIAECPVLGAGKIPLVSSDFHLRSLKFKE